MSGICDTCKRKPCPAESEGLRRCDFYEAGGRMSELKPCPFCGGSASVHYWGNDDTDCTIMCDTLGCRASVSARSCGSMTQAYSKARKAWNRRTATVDVTRFCEVSGL